MQNLTVIQDLLEKKMRLDRIIFLNVMLFCIPVLCFSNTYSAEAPVLHGGVIAPNASQYIICLEDFRVHFNGYIYGINQIIRMRDGRRVESFRAPIPNAQLELLNAYLATIPNSYVGAGRIKEISDEFEKVKRQKSFRPSYEQISERNFEEGYQFHHIIPKELNGCNNSWNFIQLSQDEHTLFTNFSRDVIPWLKKRTLGGDGAAIRTYINGKYSEIKYKGHKVADLYLDWLDLRH